MEFLGEHACEEWLKDNPKLRNYTLPNFSYPGPTATNQSSVPTETIQSRNWLKHQLSITGRRKWCLSFSASWRLVSIDANLVLVHCTDTKHDRHTSRQGKKFNLGRHLNICRGYRLNKRSLRPNAKSDENSWFLWPQRKQSREKTRSVPHGCPTYLRCNRTDTNTKPGDSSLTFDMEAS